MENQQQNTVQPKQGAQGGMGAIQAKEDGGRMSAPPAFQLKAGDGFEAGSALQMKSDPSAPVQRLAIQYGTDSPIPADAQGIADAQNATRGVDIAVQHIGTAIADQVITDMGDGETIYIVAHGCAPIGDKPAILEDGAGGTLSGAALATLLDDLRTRIKAAGKTVGPIKLEACMSGLSRKTESGLFGEYFVDAKPSLVEDTLASLKSVYDVDDIEITGNLGLSTGTDFSANGVENLSPKNTELSLLGTVVEKLCAIGDADWSGDAATALKKDGRNIIRKYGAELTKFDRDSQVSELITTTTAAAITAFLDSSDKDADMTGDMYSVITLLQKYARNDPA